MNLRPVKFIGLFVLVGICLFSIAAFPDSRSEAGYVHSIPALQQPATPTPRPNCSVPPYPAAAYGQQPYPTEIAPYFDKAGLNQMGNSGPQLPTMDGQAAYMFHVFC